MFGRSKRVTPMPAEYFGPDAEQLAEEPWAMGFDARIHSRKILKVNELRGVNNQSWEIRKPVSRWSVDHARVLHGPIVLDTVSEFPSMEYVESHLVPEYGGGKYVIWSRIPLQSVHEWIFGGDPITPDQFKKPTSSSATGAADANGSDPTRSFEDRILDAYTKRVGDSDLADVLGPALLAKRFKLDAKLLIPQKDTPPNPEDEELASFLRDNPELRAKAMRRRLAKKLGLKASEVGLEEVEEPLDPQAARVQKFMDNLTDRALEEAVSGKRRGEGPSAWDRILGIVEKVDLEGALRMLQEMGGAGRTLGQGQGQGIGQVTVQQPYQPQPQAIPAQVEYVPAPAPEPARPAEFTNRRVRITGTPAEGGQSEGSRPSTTDNLQHVRTTERGAVVVRRTENGGGGNGGPRTIRIAGQAGGAVPAPSARASYPFELPGEGSEGPDYLWMFNGMALPSGGKWGQFPPATSGAEALSQLGEYLPEGSDAMGLFMQTDWQAVTQHAVADAPEPFVRWLLQSGDDKLAGLYTVLASVHPITFLRALDVARSNPVTSSTVLGQLAARLLQPDGVQWVYTACAVAHEIQYQVDQEPQVPQPQ
ncbi:MAG: hypothetical protein Q8R28_05470 [Dehalococcoidia bacterium]|nr:hypothetical protein [Dehalococcoidia bacterium]